MAEATRSNTNKPRLTTREIVVFAMLGTLMFLSKQLMEWAPNIHFLGMFTMTYTVVYRWKALIPIYLFVLLEGLYMGFALWWVPYLYLWTVLWGVTMLLPRSLPKKWAVPLYAAVCALHGLCYGTRRFRRWRSTSAGRGRSHGSPPVCRGTQSTPPATPPPDCSSGPSRSC